MQDFLLGGGGTTDNYGIPLEGIPSPSNNVGTVKMEDLNLARAEGDSAAGDSSSHAIPTSQV
jgi:hypothetical protein